MLHVRKGASAKVGGWVLACAVGLASCGGRPGAQTHGALLSLSGSRVCVTGEDENEKSCFRLTESSRIEGSLRRGDEISVRFHGKGRNEVISVRRVEGSG